MPWTPEEMARLIDRLKNEDIHAYSLEILSDTGLMVKHEDILTRLRERGGPLR